MQNKNVVRNKIMIGMLMILSAMPVCAQSNQLSVTDQQLIALLKKSEANPIPETPPKINNQDIYLFTSSVHPASTTPSVIPTANTADDSTPQRCIYNNQPYILGDMVKTDQGWIRCTPSFFFAADNPTAAQPGNAVWTKVE